MKNKLFAGLFVAAVLTGFFVGFTHPAEAAQPKSRAIPHVSPEQFENLIVKPAGTCSVDFPALCSSTGRARSAESATCTAVGCVAGDACLAAEGAISDGGTVLPTDLRLSCRATTDGVVFNLLFTGDDGGLIDRGAGFYTGRCIH